MWSEGLRLTKIRLCGAVLAVAGVAAVASPQAASALALGESTPDFVVSPGNSQNDQVGGGDLSNNEGYAVAVDFSFTRSANDALKGFLSVNLANISTTTGALIENFAISLNDAIFGSVVDSKGKLVGSSQVTAASTFLTDIDCAVDGCSYVSTIDKNLKGFMGGHITVGAATHGGGNDAKLAVGESVTFNWDVVFTKDQADLLDSVTDFLDLVSVQVAGGIESPNRPFNTFWAVHAQGLQDYSDRLGGRSVPEPATFAVLGLGLIGLGVMVRRRRSAA